MADNTEWTVISYRKQKSVPNTKITKPQNKFTQCKKIIGGRECGCCELVAKCEITLVWNDTNYKPNDFRNAGICNNDRLMRILEYRSQWSKGFSFVTQIQDEYEILSFDGKVLIANQWCAHNDTTNKLNSRNTLMKFNGRSVRIVLK